jgi:hypothetical protein
MLSLTLNSFLNYYGKEKIKITFPNATIELSLNEAHFLWYYIYTKEKNVTWNVTDNLTNIIRKTNAVSLDKLDILLEEYSKIDNIEDLYQFYISNIKSIESSYISKDENERTMRSNISPDVLNIISEIDPVTALFHIKQSFRSNSVITTTPHFQTFIDSLPALKTVTASDTTSYMLLYNLKPFHTEFLLKSHEGVIANDLQTPKDNATFDIEITQADFIDEIYDYQTYTTEYTRTDMFNFLDEVIIE